MLKYDSSCRIATSIFWQEAIAIVCYLQNRSSHKILGLETPYSLWFKHKPNLSHLQAFGFIAYRHVLADKRKKLDPRTKKYISLDKVNLLELKHTNDLMYIHASFCLADQSFFTKLVYLSNKNNMRYATLNKI